MTDDERTAQPQGELCWQQRGDLSGVFHPHVRQKEPLRHGSILLPTNRNPPLFRGAWVCPS